MKSLIIALLFAGIAVSGAAATSKRPNVVVILADDQGWGDLRLHGNNNLNTPNLDKLAEQGAQFRNFYVQPVCSPTRAEFLTGRYYPRGGVYDTGAGGERLDADEQTIADVFQENGYATGAFGKWHNGTQAPYHPLSRGFDEYYGFTSGHWGSYFDAWLDHNGAMVQSAGYLPDALTDAAISFIADKTRAGDPFFAYLALPTPHSPMQTTDADWQRFAKKELAQRYRGEEPEDLDHTRAALAMVENIDSNVGRLLQALDELDLSRDTIVVYFSDNGPNGWRWNGDMRGRKGSTDEGGTRSPLFIRWPDTISQNRVVDSIAADIDLLPTLGELAGLHWQPKLPLDGKSLASRLVGKTSDVTENRILFSYWNEHVSARDERWRLDTDGRLYDITTDRSQNTDLADAFPSEAARLSAAIQSWRDSVLGTGPNRNRPFTVGHPSLSITQLPARDAHWTGSIERSNQWPNCSYLTHWTSSKDRIYWPVEVAHAGRYRATVYYTCASENAGLTLTLRGSKSAVSAIVTQAHDPEAYGMNHDRVPREESYVKDFAPLELGIIDLVFGPQEIDLEATDLQGPQAIDFRLLVLERLDD